MIKKFIIIIFLSFHWAHSKIFLLSLALPSNFLDRENIRIPFILTKLLSKAPWCFWNSKTFLIFRTFRWKLYPRMLQNVAEIDLSTSVLGQRVSMPICVGATAMQCMAHLEGERATVRGRKKVFYKGTEEVLYEVISLRWLYTHNIKILRAGDVVLWVYGCLVWGWLEFNAYPLLSP